MCFVLKVFCVHFPHPEWDTLWLRMALLLERNHSVLSKGSYFYQLLSKDRGERTAGPERQQRPTLAQNNKSSRTCRKTWPQPFIHLHGGKLHISILCWTIHKSWIAVPLYAPGSVITGVSILCNSEIFIMKLMLSTGTRNGLSLWLLHLELLGGFFLHIWWFGFDQKRPDAHTTTGNGQRLQSCSFIWQQLLLSEILMKKDRKYQQKVLKLLQDTKIC